jgi:hypothetical protein
MTSKERAVLGRVFSRRGFVTLALVFGALTVGLAFATWTATGTGSGTAEAVTATASAITGRAGTPDLYPGFTGGDLFFTVTGPNPYPVRFTSATFGSVTSSDPTNCPASNVTVPASASGLTIDVPANDTTGTNSSIADVVSMASAAPNGCQGVSFTIGVTLSGSQQ